MKIYTRPLDERKFPRDLASPIFICWKFRRPREPRQRESHVSRLLPLQLKISQYLKSDCRDRASFFLFFELDILCKTGPIRAGTRLCSTRGSRNDFPASLRSLYCDNILRESNAFIEIRLSEGSPLARLSLRVSPIVSSGS